MSSRHAGTYICSASNGKGHIDIPTIVVVTGIVPYFAQAPNSFVALPPLPDSFIQFNFEISFKPESSNGKFNYIYINKQTSSSYVIEAATKLKSLTESISFLNLKILSVT